MAKRKSKVNHDAQLSLINAIPAPWRDQKRWAIFDALEDRHVNVFAPSEDGGRFSFSIDCREQGGVDHFMTLNAVAEAIKNGLGDGFGMITGVSTTDIVTIRADDELAVNLISKALDRFVDCDHFAVDQYKSRGATFFVSAERDSKRITDLCRVLYDAHVDDNRLAALFSFHHQPINNDGSFVPFSGKKLRRGKPVKIPVDLQENLARVSTPAPTLNTLSSTDTACGNIFDTITPVEPAAPVESPRLVCVYDSSQHRIDPVDDDKMSHRIIDNPRLHNRSALDAAKSRLAEYLADIGHPVADNGMLNCICRGHADSEPSMKFNVDDNTVHCFGCGFHGDLVDVIAEVEGLAPRSKDAIDRAIAWAGTADIPAPRGASKKKKSTAEKHSPEIDEKIQAVHSDIARALGHIGEHAPVAFLHSRGFDDADIERLTNQFRLGFLRIKKKVHADNQWRDVMIDALVIPHGADYYTARNVDPESPFRFNANAPTPVKLFNPAALKASCCFICEGAIDALSIIACGFDAVATGGAQGKKALRAELDAIDADKLPCLIVAFDSDDAGANAARTLGSDLVDRYLATVTIAPPPDGHHDYNDAFKADRDALSTYLKAQVDLAVEVHNHPQQLTTPFGDAVTNAALSDSVVVPNEVTDVSIAKYIVDTFPDLIRFNADAGKFMVYEPPVWNPLGKDAELRFVLDRFRGTIKDSTRRIDKRISRALQSTAKGNAVIAQFYSFRHLRITDADLNNHPMLINCKNGAVDLTNGKFIEHDGKQLWTKCGGFVFDPHARSETFDRFIKDILPDDATRAVVQTFLGYCLTGSVIEEKALFVHGSGGNGKGTLFRTVQKCLGDYAKPMKIDCLLAGRRAADANAASPEFNKLLHTRLAVAEEVPAGQKLDAAQFKLLTGGDFLPIRLLHHEASEIQNPSHKLILSGNALPQLSDTKDEGLKRRLLVVRFPRSFTEDNRDPELKSRLCTPEALSAVFNWLLEGCLRWQMQGLKASAEMSNELDRYLADNDIVADFIDNFCKLGENCSVSRKVLLDHVKRHAEFELRSRRDSEIIDAIVQADKSIAYKRGKNGYVLQGIDILSDDAITADSVSADGEDFVSSADY